MQQQKQLKAYSIYSTQSHFYVLTLNIFKAIMRFATYVKT
jgi:hypothetical protein